MLQYDGPQLSQPKVVNQTEKQLSPCMWRRGFVSPDLSFGGVVRHP